MGFRLVIAAFLLASPIIEAISTANIIHGLGYRPPPPKVRRNAKSMGHCHFDADKWYTEPEVTISNAVMFDRTSGISCSECMSRCESYQNNATKWVCRSLTYDHKYEICDIYAINGQSKPYYLTEYHMRDYFAYLPALSPKDRSRIGVSHEIDIIDEEKQVLEHKKVMVDVTEIDGVAKAETLATSKSTEAGILEAATTPSIHSENGGEKDSEGILKTINVKAVDIHEDSDEKYTTKTTDATEKATEATNVWEHKEETSESSKTESNDKLEVEATEKFVEQTTGPAIELHTSETVILHKEEASEAAVTQVSVEPSKIVEEANVTEFSTVNAPVTTENPSKELEVTEQKVTVIETSETPTKLSESERSAVGSHDGTDFVTAARASKTYIKSRSGEKLPIPGLAEEKLEEDPVAKRKSFSRRLEKMNLKTLRNIIASNAKHDETKEFYQEHKAAVSGNSRQEGVHHVEGGRNQKLRIDSLRSQEKKDEGVSVQEVHSGQKGGIVAHANDQQSQSAQANSQEAQAKPPHLQQVQGATYTESLQQSEAIEGPKLSQKAPEVIDTNTNDFPKPRNPMLSLKINKISPETAAAEALLREEGEKIAHELAKEAKAAEEFFDETTPATLLRTSAASILKKTEEVVSQFKVETDGEDGSENGENKSVNVGFEDQKAAENQQNSEFSQTSESNSEQTSTIITRKFNTQRREHHEAWEEHYQTQANGQELNQQASQQSSSNQQAANTQQNGFHQVSSSQKVASDADTTTLTNEELVKSLEQQPMGFKTFSSSTFDQQVYSREPLAPENVAHKEYVQKSVDDNTDQNGQKGQLKTNNDQKDKLKAQKEQEEEQKEQEGQQQPQKQPQNDEQAPQTQEQGPAAPVDQQTQSSPPQTLKLQSDAKANEDKVALDFDSDKKKLKVQKLDHAEKCKENEILRFVQFSGYEQSHKDQDAKLELLPSGTLETCQKACAESSAFECASASHSPSGCILSSKSANHAEVQSLVVNREATYLEKICLPIVLAEKTKSIFDAVPSYILVGHVQEVTDATTLVQCQIDCLQAQEKYGFRCRSAMWYPADADQNCLLNSENKFTQPTVFVPEDEGVIMFYFDMPRIDDSPDVQRRYKDIPLKHRVSKWTHWSKCDESKEYSKKYRYNKCNNEKDIRKCPKQTLNCKNVNEPSQPHIDGECRAVRDTHGNKRCPHGVKLDSFGIRHYCTPPVDCY
ncbi:unnamed protein product [Bursaphelenchus okinawaensis]|uniref:Apple domain-containing protein n=1 Tax=Bursaphelenchus okinawaensis TaxID=465554 RepID=A0A811L1Q4_9BILA|nr:unnamed protein product [Bursaphelenchus okinawaensis]CAG9115296.1 unnamed protein product [Bursaphelenchus okinawaensis]